MSDQVRVTMPNYSEFYHARTKIRFLPEVTRNAEGHQIFVARAVVDRKVAEEHFVGHDAFIVEDYAPASVTPFTPATDKTDDSGEKEVSIGAPVLANPTPVTNPADSDGGTTQGGPESKGEPELTTAEPAPADEAPAPGIPAPDPRPRRAGGRRAVR